MLISGAIDFCIPIERSHSRPLGQWSASAIPVANVHEIAAGKLCAALERNHSRDLYDVRLLHQSEWLDFDKRQLAFLVTAASSPRIDCRRITTQDLDFDVLEAKINARSGIRRQCKDAFPQ